MAISSSMKNVKWLEKILIQTGSHGELRWEGTTNKRNLIDMKIAVEINAQTEIQSWNGQGTWLSITSVKKF